MRSFYFSAFSLFALLTLSAHSIPTLKPNISSGQLAKRLCGRYNDCGDRERELLNAAFSVAPRQYTRTIDALDILIQTIRAKPVKSTSQ
jgi:hypothetical protein